MDYIDKLKFHLHKKLFNWEASGSLHWDTTKGARDTIRQNTLNRQPVTDCNLQFGWTEQLPLTQTTGGW